jgi:hypothetical protein
MVDETISRIEERILSNDSLSSEKKQELLTLVRELRGEVSVLEATHSEDARSIAGFTETSVHEATREEKNPQLLEHSLEGMKLAVESLEISHPKLVGLINNIGQTLWKIGI